MKPALLFSFTSNGSDIKVIDVVGGGIYIVKMLKLYRERMLINVILCLSKDRYYIV